MIIIPARQASTRFPNKILEPINGYPMVVLTALNAKKVDEVAVATDSEEVIKVCKEHGIMAILTSKAHTSGTDRIHEASEILNLSDDEIVINVQGDEPFLETHVIQAVKDRLHEDKNAFMVSACKRIDENLVEDVNLVKVILDINSYAIYFSRSKIPYNRDECDEYLGHIGIYGFRAKTLRQFCSFPPARLENIEKLEQLRAIYNGKKIAMVKVESKSFGIDTKEDLQKALKEFSL